MNHFKLKLLLLLLLFVASQPSVAGTQQPPDAEFKKLLKLAIESDSGFEDEFDAQVWLVDMSARLNRRAQHIPLTERMKLLKAVHREANRAKLDPQLVLAVIEIESGFERFSLSKSGARGLMQVMPFWIKEIGHDGDNLFDIDTNLRYGCTILSLYIKRKYNQVNAALASYNGSSGSSRYPDKVLKRLRKIWYVRP